MNIKTPSFNKLLVLCLMIGCSFVFYLISSETRQNNFVMQESRQFQVDRDIKASDVPSNYNALFSGNPSTVSMTPFFTNQTGINHTIIMQNSFQSDIRNASLNISGYHLPYYDLYRVDVNVTNNETVALDDWVFKISGDGTGEYIIKRSITGSENQMLAQEISGLWNYQVKVLSSRVYVDIGDGGYSTSPINPQIQIWDNGTGVFGQQPNNMYWTGDLPNGTITFYWQNVSCDYAINASSPTNRSWYVVVNCTDWAAGLNHDNDGLNWKYASGGGGAKYLTWSATDWFPSPFTMALRYKRLYLNDAGTSNRTILPTDLSLQVNSSLFDSNGRATVIGSNISELLFYSPVTSAKFNVTLKLYYKRNTTATAAFFTSGSDFVNWTVTSNDNITFPIGTSEKGINVSIPSNWDIWGVYFGQNLSDASASSVNYTNYYLDNQIVSITGITANYTWQLRCNSTNVISDLIPETSGVEITNATIGDLVNISVDFKTPQTGGKMSVVIYYPETCNDTLAKAMINNTIGVNVAHVIFNNTWWDTSVQRTNNTLGHYRIQARWNSSTAAGFIDESLLVLGDMNNILASIAQYNQSLSFSGGRYKGFYGDNVSLAYLLADFNNASVINNLSYSIQVNGSIESSGTTSQTNFLEVLDFSTRPVGNYSIMVNFSRKYYNNFTQTLILEINKCPTKVELIDILQDGQPVYRQDGIYFMNDSDDIVVMLNYTNLKSGSLISDVDVNASDGTNHFLNYSVGTTVYVNITPSIINQNANVSFTATVNKTGYE
ncbi:MAG: hypothetical protein ACTSRA_18835, partial [Promethearchaeota archaeon]